MTDPTEQTETAWFAIDNIAPVRWPADQVALACLDVLGIDPDMPVAKLRADLAIAARARACAPCDEGSDAHAAVAVKGDRCYSTAAALLAYLLNGEPERPVHPRGHDHVEGQLYCNVPGCPDLEDYFP